MLRISERLQTYFTHLVAHNRLGHGYILHGPASAFPSHAVLGMALTALCPSPSPCYQCHVCQQVLAHDHPDIRILGEGQTSVEQIRQLIRDIQFGARDGHKLFVCILDADSMTPQASNAFLKTLEEPPAGVTLILAASQETVLLPTIRSRCTVIGCPTLPEAQIRDWIQETTQHPYTGTLSDSLIGYITKTKTLPEPIPSLETCLAQTLTAHIALAEQLAKDKHRYKMALQQWLQESITLATKTQEWDYYTRIGNRLLIHLKNSSYTLNTRLHLEAVLLGLSTGE